jgi:hypothetical protein
MSQRKIGFWASTVMVVALAVVSACQGEIILSKRLDIDFTESKNAEEKASWSPSDKLSITLQGLGWDGAGTSSRDGWIQTKPMAVGLSWRPAQGVSVRLVILPPPAEVVLNNGQKLATDAGDVYVRYSPDLKHWSSWQVLRRDEPRSIDEKKTPGRYYAGNARVPYRDSEEYRKLLSGYSKLDVPWKSDEEAAVRWIIDRNPDFFSQHMPFVGYVEFLFETSLRGGQRIQSFKADVSCVIGGKHSPPKDQNAYKDRDSSPWRFKASGIETK